MAEASRVVVDTRSEALPDHAGVTIPPPFVYVAIFLAGAVIERAVPLPAVPRVIARPVAALLVLGWAILFGWSVTRFRASRTSMLPVRPTTALVVNGPYRFTRNPMYVGLLLLYAATALWFAFVWPLLLLPLVVWAVRVYVIDREERYLQRKFGDEYRSYQAAVRRWL
jgi:protein-S-isoprenylcysteine O-methyltransferase Ste14